MSNFLPPPLPVVQSARPVETLAYDSQPDNWVPSILRVFGWVAVIAGSAKTVAALVEIAANAIGGTAGGSLFFFGPDRFRWAWAVLRIAGWLTPPLLITSGILCLARARAARLSFLIWALATVSFGAGQWVLITLFFIDLGNQSRYDNAQIVAQSAQNFAWLFTASMFPAIVAIFMFAPGTRRWFESR